MIDFPELPGCLRISAEARAEAWRLNPSKPMPRDAFRPFRDPEAERQKSLIRVARMKTRAANKEHALNDRAAVASGMVWNSTKARWEMPDYTKEQIDAMQSHTAPLSKSEIQKPSPTGRRPTQPNMQTIAPKTKEAKIVRNTLVQAQNADAKTMDFALVELGVRVSEIAAQGSLKEFATRNGVWDDKYDALSNGLKRMNVVNRLRNRVKKDAKFEIKWWSR